MRVHVVLFAVTLVLLALFPWPCPAQQFELVQTGLRGGFSDNKLEEDFEQYEAFIQWGLPWRWTWPAGINLATRLDVNAGILDGKEETAFVGTIGPSLALAFAEEHLSLFTGTGVTVLSEDRFGAEGFGGPIQFTSYAGLSAVPIRNLVAGYRFQHMSNAGIYKNNPGLNLHMFELVYRF